MVLRSPDSFSCEPVDMEKLMEIRNAHLVRVRGELAAAENLAGRQASVGEAQDRLNLLRELAGDFRRTQTAIEEEENPEASAAIHDFREEFNEPYYSARNILERYVSAHSPAKSGFPPGGNKNINNNHDLRETMRLVLKMQRATAEDKKVPNLEETFEQIERLLSSEDTKEELPEELACNNNNPETHLDNGNVAEVSMEAFRGIDGILPPAQTDNDLDFEASLPTFGDQEEVPKLRQLTTSGQTATALTRNTDGSFIVRPPVGETKSTPGTYNSELDFHDYQQSTQSTKTNGVATCEEITFMTETRLSWQMSVDALDKDSGLVGIRKAQLHAAMARRRVGEIPVRIGLCKSRRITSVKEPEVECLPQRRQNRWKLMHCPTSEIWKRGQSNHLFGLQPGTEKRFLKANVKEDEQLGPPVQIGSDDDGGSGLDWSRPEGEVAASMFGARRSSAGLRDVNGLRHTCLKAGEYVPVF